MSKVRWGILSGANIARKNVLAMKEAVNADPIAVASRQLEKARSWAEENDLTTFYGSYDELLASDVDAIYLPVVTSHRAEWAVKAANAGKHILIEKPAGVNADQVRAVLDAANRNKVVCMDGVMFMHHPRLQELRKVIDGEIGSLRMVDSAFTFPGDQSEEFMSSNIRVNAATEPLGCIGDLAWYNVRFSMFVFEYRLPKRIRCDIHRKHDGVPLDATGTLDFGDGCVATWHASFATSFQQRAHVVGSKASVHLDDFVIPKRHGDDCYFSIDRADGLADKDRRVADRLSEITVSGVKQECAMIEKFSSMVQAGYDSSEDDRKFFEDIALKGQLVMDASMKSADQDGAWVNL